MTRYMVVRAFDVTEGEMAPVGQRSRALIEGEFPEIEWEHSHVVVGTDGFVRTYCVYAAPNEEAVRLHSSRLGQHVLESIEEIVGDVTPENFPPV